MHGHFDKATPFDPWPKDSGQHRLTRRGGALYSFRSPSAQEFAPENHWLLVLLSPIQRLRLALGDDEPRTTNVTAGMVSVVPASVACRASWGAELENVVVAIEPCRLKELAAEEFGRSDIELSPTYPVLDKVAFKLATLLKDELQASAGSNELFLESLVTLMGLHALRTYSNLNGPKRRVRASLSASATGRVKAYLQENFRRKVTIPELAELCGLSAGHFSEAFAKTFGLPPHRYVLELRLEHAERLLRETDTPIPEVAFLSGFSSQSHLTHMMRAHWGKTPNKVRAG